MYYTISHPTGPSCPTVHFTIFHLGPDAPHEAHFSPRKKHLQEMGTLPISTR